MAIVALPIVIVTSYVLYQRRKFSQAWGCGDGADDRSSDSGSGEEETGATAWRGLGA